MPFSEKIITHQALTEATCIFAFDTFTFSLFVSGKYKVYYNTEEVEPKCRLRPIDCFVAIVKKITGSTRTIWGKACLKC